MCIINDGVRILTMLLLFCCISSPIFINIRSRIDISTNIDSTLVTIERSTIDIHSHTICTTCSCKISVCDIFIIEIIRVWFSSCFIIGICLITGFSIHLISCVIRHHRRHCSIVSTCINGNSIVFTTCFISSGCIDKYILINNQRSPNSLLVRSWSSANKNCTSRRVT